MISRSSWPALTRFGEGGFRLFPSAEMAHIVWDDASLDQWLADPDTLVPVNNTEFHVAKPQERLDLISFLKQRAGK